MISSPGPQFSFQQEVERLRASGVLGEAKVRRLFDYLAALPVDELPPKETTIAIDVFGKSSSFDVSQDALVRVYVHKLRRILEEFYAARHDHGSLGLQIPRGEYRLVLRSDASPASKSSEQPDNTSKIPRTTDSPRYTLRHVAIAAAFGAAASAASLMLFLGVIRPRTASSDIDLVRNDPVWAQILEDDRPILVVVGDYYLIGETDDSMEVTRLIREYSVNSKNDLENYINQHPEVADRYMDVGLRYLPTSTAFALRNIVPVLDTGKRRVNLSTISDVTPVALKSNNIVYIGYLSGLGILQQMVFAGSRFAIGETYDELRDTKTKHVYISQAPSQNMGMPQSSGKEPSYRDYGYFSTFRGPGGNTVVVISGTRDEGVRQTAEAFTNSAKLGELRRQIDTREPFEALIEVSALDGVNLSGKSVVAARR